MPKDRRGGKSLKKQPYKEYEEIGKANKDTIKVIMSKPDSNNAGIPLFSNKRSTVYFIVNRKNAEKTGKNEITNIGVYRNRHLVYDIDLDRVQGIHYHEWRLTEKKGKKTLKKDGYHNPNLKPTQIRLIKMANDWNRGGNKA